METIIGIQRIKDEDFNLLKEIIHRESGIRLTEMKRALVQARVMKRLRALKIWNYEDYCQYLTDNYDQEIINLINCITTNKTDFFREAKHFEFMKEVVLPEFEQGCKKEIRIWSAGCSTGAEPYSIAITVLEYYSGKKMPDVKILATDIDTQVLRKGEEGIYDISEIESVDINILKKYFMRGSGVHDGAFKIKDFVKKIIYFRRLNLFDDVYPMKKLFNIIFCRNVIIYFDVESRERLLSKFYNFLYNDAYLIMGHSETMAGLTSNFRFIGNTIYKKAV